MPPEPEEPDVCPRCGEPYDAAVESGGSEAVDAERGCYVGTLADDDWGGFIFYHGVRDAA